MEEIEEWRTIPSFPEYEASSLGRVRSFDKYIPHCRWPGFTQIVRGRILSPCTNNWGYVNVHLSKDQKHYTKKAHRLVAEAFHTNPENKPQVNHKNGIKDDNRAENLEWVTLSENAQHAVDTGLAKLPWSAKAKGSENPSSKLDEAQVLEIREKLAQGNTCTALGLEYGLGHTTISCIKLRKTWKHI
jgi:hypothetical protein